MNASTRTHQMMSLQQAIHAAPTLAHLSDLVAQSQKRLAIILPLLPAGMRADRTVVCRAVREL